MQQFPKIKKKILSHPKHVCLQVLESLYHQTFNRLIITILWGMLHRSSNSCLIYRTSGIAINLMDNFKKKILSVAKIWVGNYLAEKIKLSNLQLSGVVCSTYIKITNEATV